MNNYVIYNTVTGVVSMVIQTSDPAFLALNTPDGHRSIVSAIKNIDEINNVNVETEEVVLKNTPTPNLGNLISHN